MVQSPQVSVSTSSPPSAQSPQIHIQRPLGQQVRQHYGYRVDPNFTFTFESQLSTDPGFHHNAFCDPTTLARERIATESRYYEFDYEYCIDPERRPVELLYMEWVCDDSTSDNEEDEEEEFGNEDEVDEDDEGEDEDEDEDVEDEDDACIIFILSVFIIILSLFTIASVRGQRKHK